jgi:hypothetical protein
MPLSVCSRNSRKRRSVRFAGSESAFSHRGAKIQKAPERYRFKTAVVIFVTFDARDNEHNDCRLPKSKRNATMRYDVISRYR